MSDLFCPARVVVTPSSSAVALADALVAERVAAVLAADREQSHDAARELAARLGTSYGRLPEGTLRVALEAVADLHRGETVVVVTDADLAQLPGRPGAPVLVEIDADGWRTQPVSRPG